MEGDPIQSVAKEWREALKKYGGGIAVGFVTALIAVIVLMSAYTRHWDASYQAARNASDYSDDAKSDVAAKCRGLAGQAYDDCSDEINNPAREDQREEYDLAAQRIVALWTTVMGGMAVLGVALSAIGVYLIFGTFRQTAEAAENSRKTYNAFIAVEQARLKISVSGQTAVGGNLMVHIAATNIGKASCVVHTFAEAWQTTARFDEIRGYLSRMTNQHIGSAE